ncbi:MAG: hypothetical protein FD141_176 [Fusobacteria bacterium]|nr:MAG: hypothetical protein FD141_176 [Fusobacteriota bacterium]KAF0229160.1 MAG: hypothetical protein FD182_1416 [Fusobacteriota bacterium]
MKVKIKYSLILLLLITILTFTIMGCSSSDNVNKINNEIIEKDEDFVQLIAKDFDLTLEGYGAKGAFVDKDMSIGDMLMYAVQDEYIARAEYAAIIEEFDATRPYSNILKSEDTHLDYLKDIYETYDLVFPKDESSALLVMPTSLLESAKAGVQAEIANIAMYEKFLKYELPQDIKNVFDTLVNGSKNHLAAYQKQVEKLS